ncbi:MAG: hypothetical protein Q9186_002922 [Xanthomendoza sp. 1 TL-2023]
MTVASDAFELAVALLFALCTAYVIQQTILSPLKSIPGPFLARFSNLWQFFVYAQGKQFTVLQRLHNRYGPIVRVGPKHLSLNSPTLVKTVYSLRGEYVKVATLFDAWLTRQTQSDRYCASDSKSYDGHNIPVQFSTRDENHHTIMWRPIAKYYSLSHLLSFEAHIDDVIRTLQRRLLQDFCDGQKVGAVCDMFKWLTFASWEVVMITNFSQMQGFLKEGKDIQGSVADSAFATDIFTALGHLPKLERFFRLLRRGKPTRNGALQLSLHQIAERHGLASECIHDPPDFLDNFLDAQKAYPETVDEDRILAYVVANIAAGGDSGGASMSAVLYHTIKHPRVLKRLQEEFDAEVSQTPISWKEASRLTYWDAVVQESLRFHPGVSFTMERVVPKEGLALPDGAFIQPGTIVGMHPWVINRNHSIFGRDADFFIPERWLQKEHEDPFTFTTRVSLMKNTMLSFGAGKRACIGKHLAFLNIYKIVGTLLATFDFELVHPGQEPKVVHSSFVRMKDFDVTMTPRVRNVMA